MFTVSLYKGVVTNDVPNPDAFIEFMVEAVKVHSTQLQLDSSQTKLRAQHKRCVVVLREIDKDTPEEEIMSLFDNCAGAKCLHCEFAGNRSWYLSFKDEVEAQVAVHHLKEDVQTFRGENLFARIKTIPIPRGIMLPQSTSQRFNSRMPSNESDMQQVVVDSASIMKSPPLLSPQSTSLAYQPDDDVTRSQNTSDLVSPTALAQAKFGDAGGGKYASVNSPTITPSNNTNHMAYMNSSEQQQSTNNMQAQSQTNMQYQPAATATAAAYPYNQESYKYYLNPSKNNLLKFFSISLSCQWWGEKIDSR